MQKQMRTFISSIHMFPLMVVEEVNPCMPKNIYEDQLQLLKWIQRLFSLGIQKDLGIQNELWLGVDINHTSAFSLPQS